MGVAEQARKLTEAEYLALERAAEFKSEYFDITISLGRVFANVKFVPGPIRPQTPRPV